MMCWFRFLRHEFAWHLTAKTPELFLHRPLLENSCGSDFVFEHWSGIGGEFRCVCFRCRKQKTQRTTERHSFSSSPTWAGNCDIGYTGERCSDTTVPNNLPWKGDRHVSECWSLLSHCQNTNNKHNFDFEHEIYTFMFFEFVVVDSGRFVATQFVSLAESNVSLHFEYPQLSHESIVLSFFPLRWLQWWGKWEVSPSQGIDISDSFIGWPFRGWPWDKHERSATTQTTMTIVPLLFFTLIVASNNHDNPVYPQDETSLGCTDLCFWYVTWTSHQCEIQWSTRTLLWWIEWFSVHCWFVQSSSFEWLIPKTRPWQAVMVA